MERPRDASAAAAAPGGADTREQLAAILDGGEEELRAWLASIVDSSDDAIVSIPYYDANVSDTCRQHTHVVAADGSTEAVA